MVLKCFVHIRNWQFNTQTFSIELPRRLVHSDARAEYGIVLTFAFEIFAKIHFSGDMESMQTERVVSSRYFQSPILNIIPANEERKQPRIHGS
jgi:hypothetical protein